MDFWLGLALHNPDWSRPEYKLNNPVGIVEIEHSYTDHIKVFFKHESGLTELEEGYGSNQIGFKVRIK